MNTIYTVGIGNNLIKKTAEILGDISQDGDLSRIAVVFPGMRPNIYLLKYLTDIYKKVYLPPVRFSMEQFIEWTARKKSPEFFKVDIIDASYILYEIVKRLKENYIGKYTTIIDKWDKFFPWGIKLANAIDEIDIAMIQEKKIKEIEEIETMDDAITPYIRALWTSMSSIRENYHNIMKDNGFTTRGMDYQYAVEMIQKSGAEAFQNFDKLYFVGFNALNHSEEYIIRTLWQDGKAEIIWQTHIDEMRKSKKGSPYYFHRKIWKSWGMPRLVSLSPSIKQDYKKYHFYEGFNIHSQVKNVKKILSNGENYENTAVVLPKGDTLIPVVEEVVLSDKREFNITMGYPLIRTSVYTIFEFIFRAQETREKNTGFYYYKDYLSVIKHPYVRNMGKIPEKNIVQNIEDFIKERNIIFIDIQDILDKVKFTPEARSLIKKIHKIFFETFQSVDTLLSLSNAIERVLEEIFKNSPAKQYIPAVEYFSAVIEILGNIRTLEIAGRTFEKRVLFNIIRGYAKTKDVHFYGEPLRGIQIMGMLETRTLKFDRVIILDVNEGIVPGVYKYDPLLPIGLRKSLGLGDYKDRESLYAYNFFRLVNGARDVHIIYNTGEDTDNKNIRSRFVEKIIWDIEKETRDILENPEVLSFNLKISKPEILSRKKTQNIIEKLKKKKFSSSSLDTYIHCPLKFYFQSGLEFREIDEVEELPDRMGIGNIIHKTLERFYLPYKGKTIEIKDGEKKLEHILKETIENEEKYGNIDKSGTLMILFDIAKYRLKNFLKKERERIEKTPIKILGVEECYGCKSGIPYMEFRIDKETPVMIGGKIDRVDKIDEDYLIIDYKTGSTPEMPNVKKTLEEDYISVRAFMKDIIQSTQLPLYILLYTDMGKSIDYKYIDAGIYSIQKSCIERIFKKDEDSKTAFMEKFIEAAKELFNEIFNPDIPFEADASDEHYCSYCPFSTMCQK